MKNCIFYFEIKVFINRHLLDIAYVIVYTFIYLHVTHLIFPIPKCELNTVKVGCLHGTTYNISAR